MANAPFTKEQLDYLNLHFAPIPHDHSWDQIKDTDGETLSERVIQIDGDLEALEEAVGQGEDDGEGEAE